jgi:uncharacterized protein
MEPMESSAKQPNILTISIQPRPEVKSAFWDWQSNLNANVAAFPGFVSLDIFLANAAQDEWMIVQRFHNAEDLRTWRASTEYQELMAELQAFAISNSLQEAESTVENLKGGITEVFITKVSPQKESEYRTWTAKIHQIEAKFPGFKGVYVQSPSTNQGGNWITLLQFDTPEHLDQWLISPERQELLKQGNALIDSIESHRMISPYAGWFTSATREGKAPAAWKQTMIVLLVLFPIVMLEFKYLSPWTKNLNLSLGTFIGNAISVSLVSWPLVPIAIWCLGWWLNPPPNKKFLFNAIGTLIVLLLYLIEIAFFWNFLD